MLKILVIRNDKLGDFMLAWPALSLLKKLYPEAKVSVLAPSYTKPIAEICPWIDNIIIDNSHEGTISDAFHLAKIIKVHDFDISISLFSEMRTAIALWLSGIPRRIGPATKIAQIFLNKRLKQKRSLSLKPEYEYNNDLIRHLALLNSDDITEAQPPPYLQFEQNEISRIRKFYIEKNNIAPDKKIIFIHAGSGGSAINLSLQQYADLAEKINKSNTAHFILTAGPGESGIANELSGLMTNIGHSVFNSTEGIVHFSKFISICDLFISGSTGPLHIAGALNLNTAAFYPARKSATPLRWQTINSKEKRISFSPEKYTGHEDMMQIDIPESARSIIEHFAL